MKFTIASIILLLSCLAIAEEPPVTPPLDPAYAGTQGMVIFNQGSALLASNLPSYQKPNNAQLIYKIKSKHSALLYLVRDAKLVTIKTDKFNLQRLFRNEEVTVNADVYIGHFDQKGDKIYKDIDITFTEQLYLRMLEDLAKTDGQQTYDEVQLSKGARLLVHQIQKAPSFEHIVMVFEQKSCMTSFRTGQLVPKENALLNRLRFCGSMKRVFYQALN